MRNNFRVDEVEEVAGAWLLKRERPEWSAADEAALTEWLGASTNHRVAFIRLASVWREADRMKALRAGLPSGKVPPPGVIGRSPFFTRTKHAAVPSAETRSDVGTSRPRHPPLKYGLAASVLLAVAVGFAAYLWPPSAPTYRTAIGGLATVPMDDGSKITLNTASEITLQMTSKERRVNLTRGEAFFEVAKDPSRPFVVYANGQRVIAIGTKFAVRLKPETVQVSVTEGQVRVEQQQSLLGLVDGAWNPRQARTASRQLPLLTPGTIANVKEKTVSIERQPVAELEHSLSWRSGYVVLREAYLSDAVAEFNRYNHRQLVIADESLAGIQIGGNFQASNIDGFVRLLEEGFEIRAQERDGRIALSRR